MQYCEIPLQDFIDNRDIPYEIFIRLTDEKFVKLASHSRDLGREQLEGYRSSGVSALFLRSEDFTKLLRIELTTGAPPLNQIEEQTFAELQREADVAVELVFGNELNEFTYEIAKTVVSSVLGFAAHNHSLLTVLTAFRDSAQSKQLYKHSVAASLYGVMIALRMGWTSASDLYHLGLGGLLHDIGGHSVRPPLDCDDPNELVLWRNHPIQGAAALELLGGVPSAVIQIVLQHHEAYSGAGFPQGFAGEEIHSMARIVALADGFCEIAFKVGVKPPVRELIDKLRDSGLYDPRALEALANLFLD